MSKYSVGDKIVMTRTGVWCQHGDDIFREQKKNGFVIISEIQVCNERFFSCSVCGGVMYFFRHDPHSGRCNVEPNSYKYPFLVPKPKPFKLRNNEQI